MFTALSYAAGEQQQGLPLTRLSPSAAPHGEPAAPAASQKPENRRHRRAPLPLAVRYLAANGEEGEGRLTNVSAGGARIAGASAAAVGDVLILYVEKLGRFDACVVRREEDGFAVRFSHKAARAKRLCDTLTFLVNSAGDGIEKRGARRFPQDEPARMVLPDGSIIDCRILDISTTGASVGVKPRPGVGTHLRVGRMQARVVRHHEDGIGVVFAQAEPEGSACSEAERTG